jgi:diguanylate cyclase (GGDEF)-like protein/PAS domain S-box-containing protein
MHKPVAPKSIQSKTKADLEAELENLYAHISVCGLCDIPDVDASLQQLLLDDSRSQSVIMDLALDAIVVIDETGAIITFNKSAEKMFGYKRREVKGREIASVIIPPSFREQHYAGFNRFITTGEAHIMDKRVEVTAMRSTEEEFPVELTVTAFHVRGVRFFTAFIRDISERVAMEKRLREETALVQLLHRLTSLANEASSTEMAMKSYLREVCEYTGWTVGHVYLVNHNNPSAELVSSNFWYLADKAKYEPFRRCTEQTTLTSGIGLPGRVLLSGKPLLIADLSSDLNFPRTKVSADLQLKTGIGLPIKIGSEVVGVLEFFTPDIKPTMKGFLDTLGHIGIELGRVVEREQNAEKLKRLADLDSLTGLPNLRVGRDRLIREIVLAKRNKNQFALLFIDLDGFKDINDNYGHEVGDCVLKVVSKRIAQSLRDVDTVARVGGDEFIVIISPVESRQAIATVSQKVIDTVAEPIQAVEEKTYLGASIGIALYPDDALHADELLKLADQAMYRVKHSGKNSFCFINDVAE